MTIQASDLAVMREDILAVVNFVTGWFPGYEGAISWGENLQLEDYEWGQAALRLKEAMKKLDTVLPQQQKQPGDKQE